jgi:hypothetical protein
MLMALHSARIRNADMRSPTTKNIDGSSMLIHIERRKGGRDWYVRLTPTLLATPRVFPFEQQCVRVSH